MHISQNGLHFIEGFEGFSSKPYWDSYGGVWTRGYGETEGIGPNSPWISKAQGEANLRHLIEHRYEYAINDLHVPLNQNQFDALASFVWNLGAGIFQGSTIGSQLRSKDFSGAANSLLAYDHAGGVRLEGLTRRRHAERDLFLSGASEPNAAVLTREEAEAVKQYLNLKQHSSRHPVAWAKARRHITDLRKAIWTAAEQGKVGAKTVQKGWGINNRAVRYNILWRYR